MIKAAGVDDADDDDDDEDDEDDDLFLTGTDLAVDDTDVEGNFRLEAVAEKDCKTDC
jgi:hypothetical protein